MLFLFLIVSLRFIFLGILDGLVRKKGDAFRRHLCSGFGSMSSKMRIDALRRLGRISNVAFSACALINIGCFGTWILFFELRGSGLVRFGLNRQSVSCGVMNPASRDVVRLPTSIGVGLSVANMVSSFGIEPCRAST